MVRNSNISNWVDFNQGQIGDGDAIPLKVADGKLYLRY